jgi:hypothetical protein
MPPGKPGWKTICLPMISDRLANRLFPMLLVTRIPSFPPALITTASISAPLLTTTKFATTGSVDADGVSEPA